MDWDALDFLAAGLLLLSAGLSIWIALRILKPGLKRYLLLIGGPLLVVLVWIQLAVGIF